MEEQKVHKMHKQVQEEVGQKINKIIEEGINSDNLDILGKLVDIHKDIANEHYWLKKEEVYENELRKLWR